MHQSLFVDDESWGQGGSTLAFVLPFERQLHLLEEQLATLSEGSEEHARVLASLHACEQEVYTGLSAYDIFELSKHPMRPKALDYIGHIFEDVRFVSNPNIYGDHLIVGGEARITIGSRLVDVVVIGQQTGPSSQRDELLRLPIAEYQRWNQGMGYPDSYRKAAFLIDIAERKGCPIVVFVDTPGADPSEYAEDEGQAFAINEVIHKTTSLSVPNLSYIVSLGASGGAIAFTATNRTIMNEYATYMVISPGGCASILFRNRNPESIMKAVEGLHLTSKNAREQNTVDEIVAEGCHPGHRYPAQLLANGEDAVKRNLARLLDIPAESAERLRREKFYAMGAWGKSPANRRTDALARLAQKQMQDFDCMRCALTKHLDAETSKIAQRNGKPPTKAAAAAGVEARMLVARTIHAAEKRDMKTLLALLNRNGENISNDLTISDHQWDDIHAHILARRYGHSKGTDVLHRDDDQRANHRKHPVDWIQCLTDPGTFHEFEKTMDYCAIDQLEFPQYKAVLERGIKKTGLHSGLITGKAWFGTLPAVLTINNIGLVVSSLCDEIGEKFRVATECAMEAGIPMISVSLGGGARMQEGTPSMHHNIPKVHHALNSLESAGIPHVSIIADPTLGGTAISYGLRGDYMIVVKGAGNIGFTGRRVVEQFQQRKVTKDFQHGSWLLHRGFVDEHIPPDSLATRLAELLYYVAEGGNLRDLRNRRIRTWQPASSKTAATGTTPSDSE